MAPQIICGRQSPQRIDAAHVNLLAAPESFAGQVSGSLTQFPSGTSTDEVAIESFPWELAILSSILSDEGNSAGVLVQSRIPLFELLEGSSGIPNDVGTDDPEQSRLSDGGSDEARKRYW